MTKENLNIDSEFGFELLTISNPGVRASMTRYTKAFRIALTGHKDHHPGLKIQIGMGFGMSDETDEAYQEATRQDGCDRLYLRFDVDNALGPPDGMGLVRIERGETVLIGRCSLWMPRATGKPVIAFEHEGQYGHFAYCPGDTLRRVNAVPALDLRPGINRAQLYLAALVASKRLERVEEPHITMRIANIR